MTNTAKKKVQSRRSASVEQPVLYRGIKIAPMPGTRSPLAKAIRDGLRTMKSGQPRGETVQA
jgi:hypothetical protein